MNYNLIIREMFMRTPFSRILLFSIIVNVSFSFGQNLIPETTWELVADGFQFPEGPAWSDDEILYFSDCYGGWIGKISNSEIDTFAQASDSTFIKTNGIVVGEEGELFVCEYGEGKILKVSSSGEVSTLIDGFQGKSFNRPNDLAFDQTGNLYFSDPKGYQAETNEGRVFIYNFSEKNLRLVADSLDFPNGLGVSPLTKKLYLSESGKSRILEFEITESGTLINKRIFVELSGGDPDGIDFDVYGNLYVAHFGTGKIFVISPEGKKLQEIKTPGTKPSNVEFGDSDWKTLYITEDETNSIYKIRTLYPGYKKW